AREVRGDARGSALVEIQRCQRDVGEFQEMRALAAGGGASVQHALAGVQVEQVGRALRAKVLHRNLTRVESRQSLDRERPVEQQRLAAAWPRVDTLLGELAVIGRYGGAPPIHAQAHRRMTVAALE